MPVLDLDGLTRYDGKLKDYIGRFANWQKTSKAGAVSFWPVGNSPLEGTVEFMFKEIPPANGEKSPTNPSTITGVSSISLCRTGRNVIDISNVNSYSYNGVTATPLDDGSIVLNGTLNSSDNSYLQLSDDFYPHVDSKMVMSALSISGTYTNPPALQIVGYTATGGQDYILWQYTNRDVAPVTIINNYRHRARLCIPHGSTFENYKFYPMIELGDTPSNEFELGTFDSFSFSLGSTYYGGEIDLATGLMTVTVFHGVFNSPYTIVDVQTDNTYICFQQAIYGDPAHGSNIDANLACNMFPTNGNGEKLILRGNAGTMAIALRMLKSRLDVSGAVDPSNPTNQEWMDAFTAWCNSNNTIEYTYTRETPLAVQLSPLALRALIQPDKYVPRLNTVYSDQESVQVGYIKSPIRTEYELTQAIIATEGGE